MKVIGYVHTKEGYPSISGYRNYNDVLNDIDFWFNEYGVDGIFVDEVTNRWPEPSYDSVTLSNGFYSDIIDYILDIDSSYIVVLNPGSA